MAEADAFMAGRERGSRVPDKGGVLASAKDPVLRPGPISIYISRKTGKLYLRKGFEEVLEAPVTIAQPDAPLGTHVFSALKGDDEAVHWNVVSLPTDRLVKKGKYLETLRARREAAQGAGTAGARNHPAGRPERRARPHHDPGGDARAHQRVDVARRLADHLGPRAEPRDRQGHGFHRAHPVSARLPVTGQMVA